MPPSFSFVGFFVSYLIISIHYILRYCTQICCTQPCTHPLCYPLPHMNSLHQCSLSFIALSKNSSILSAESCFFIKLPLDLFFNTTLSPILSLYWGLLLKVVPILPSAFCLSSSFIFNKYSSPARSVIFMKVRNECCRVIWMSPILWEDWMHQFRVWIIFHL